MTESKIVRSISLIVKYLDNSYQNSIIKKLIVLFMNIFLKINAFYEESFLGKSIGAVCSFFKRLFNSSVIIEFLFGKGSLIDKKQDSLFLKGIDNIFNPSILKKQQEFFKGSFFLNLIGLLYDRVEIVLGLVLAGIMLVEHSKWNNLYNTLIAVVFLGVFSICTLIRKEARFNTKAIDFSLFLFAISIVLACVFSISRSSSIRFIVFYITGFLFIVLITSTVQREKALKAFLNCLLIGVFLVGSFGAYQALTHSVPFNASLTDLNGNEGMPGRVFATFENPNNFAELLIIFIPFFITMILNTKSMVKKVVYFSMCVPVIISFFSTGSRIAWGALAVGLIVFTFFKNKRLLPLFALMGIVCIPFVPDFIIKRIQTLGNLSTDSSTQYRGKILTNILPMFFDNLVSGVGLGTDAFALALKKYKTTIGLIPHSHIVYLQVWIEMGFVGIFTFLWFIFRTIKTLIYTMQTANRKMKNYLIASLSSFVGILTISCVEYVWFYPRVMMFFFVLIGIVFATISISVNEKRSVLEKE